MIQIRPVSDLRNKFADISKNSARKSWSYLFNKKWLCWHGCYECLCFWKNETGNYIKLKEAELEAKSTATRFSSKEVFAESRADYW